MFEEGGHCPSPDGDLARQSKGNVTAREIFLSIQLLFNQELGENILFPKVARSAALDDVVTKLPWCQQIIRCGVQNHRLGLSWGYRGYLPPMHNSLGRCLGLRAWQQ